MEASRPRSPAPWRPELWLLTNTVTSAPCRYWPGFSGIQRSSSRYTPKEIAAIFTASGLYRHQEPSRSVARSTQLPAGSFAGSLAEIHERAPVVLHESTHATWLDRKITDPA